MRNSRIIEILDEKVAPGETKTINLEIAKFHTATRLKVPIIVSRSKTEGPTVLLSAGIHGDELNGIDIVRQLIHQKINIPKTGTIICIPVINIFGFINKTREFPDGRDLNRMFPGSKAGSLASQFAHYLVKHILPLVDYAIDFHAGGASRFNAPQIRIAPGSPELDELAGVFQAPFVLYSNYIAGSFRNACAKRQVKMLLFEGGKSMDINRSVSDMGVAGTKRFLDHLGMLRPAFTVPISDQKICYIAKSYWIRAKNSGLFLNRTEIGSYVTKGSVLAVISDPYGKGEQPVKAPYSGYIINTNDASIVYQGDAIFHISTALLQHD